LREIPISFYLDTMTVVATPAYLDHLKSIFPAQSSPNPWFIVAIVVFTAANRPDEVPRVFAYAMKDTRTEEEKVVLASKCRDVIFKAGMITGYSKAINSLKALYDATPEPLRETKILRNVNTTLEEYDKLGKQAFTQLYGNTAQGVQDLLDRIYPEIGWFSNTIAYGLMYGYTEVVSGLETSYTLVAALIAVDTPLQINWHQENARRAGASKEEIRAVRAIAMEVGRSLGIDWKDGVPEIQE